MQTEMTRVTILIWEKTDFKTKDIQKDKGGYCIMIKGPLQRDANKHEGRNWQEYNSSRGLTLYWNQWTAHSDRKSVMQKS